MVPALFLTSSCGLGAFTEPQTTLAASLGGGWRHLARSSPPPPALPALPAGRLASLPRGAPGARRGHEMPDRT